MKDGTKVAVFWWLYMVAGFIFCLWAAVMLFGCGEGVLPPFRVCSEMTAEEQEDVQFIVTAFRNLGYEPHGCLYLIRDVHEEAPCLDSSWIDYRWSGIPPTDPSVGYGGVHVPWCGSYVCRVGSKEPYFVELVIHELAHNVGFYHGVAMRKFECEVREMVKELRGHE